MYETYKNIVFKNATKSQEKKPRYPTVQDFCPLNGNTILGEVFIPFQIKQEKSIFY